MAAQNDTRFDPRGGPRDRTLRVGDREREAVGDILREQHLEGRLDSDEFQKRLERCLTAKTYAELDSKKRKIVKAGHGRGDRGRSRSCRSPCLLP
jgi:hypothetical protein